MDLKRPKLPFDYRLCDRLDPVLDNLKIYFLLFTSQMIEITYGKNKVTILLNLLEL